MTARTSKAQQLAALKVVQELLGDARYQAQRMVDVLTTELVRSFKSADQNANFSALSSAYLVQDFIDLSVQFYGRFEECGDLRLEVRDGFFRVVHGSVPGSSGVDQVSVGADTPVGALSSNKRKHKAKGGVK